jgi:hypothetical protein
MAWSRRRQNEKQRECSDESCEVYKYMKGNHFHDMPDPNEVFTFETEGEAEAFRLGLTCGMKDVDQEITSTVSSERDGVWFLEVCKK